MGVNEVITHRQIMALCGVAFVAVSVFGIEHLRSQEVAYQQWYSGAVLHTAMNVDEHSVRITADRTAWALMPDSIWKPVTVCAAFLVQDEDLWRWADGREWGHPLLRYTVVDSDGTPIDEGSFQCRQSGIAPAHIRKTDER